MKRRSILLSVFGGMLALSMSAFAITGIPKKAATAETNAQNYWKTIFDVESTGEVTFTSQADAPRLCAERCANPSVRRCGFG